MSELEPTDTPAAARESTEPSAGPAFRDLELDERLLRALDEVGYEQPTPIQARMIPHMLAGSDVLGQAQTGTGKTAAFALPTLTRVDLAVAKPQVLVLTPTRELAIQVAEAYGRYAAHLPGFHVVPIYGGQAYPVQLRALSRGVHVVVGTPGRVMDHIRRESLKLDALKTVVLDEADEMLRMGFLEDVSWILERTPGERQIALFSATMPPPVRRIAEQHLRDPVPVTIEQRTANPSTIHQRFWVVSGTHKLDALTRILEAEPTDGMLVFVRTKNVTVELAERLEARGYTAAPLSGDVPQNARERTVERFKSGKLDILVATDVAARGLDVDRVSHVVNFDIPYDTEAYVHRIGRTGRAGRAGEAILFVAPRERSMLRSIERAIGQPIERMELPTTEEVNEQRLARFKKRITETLGDSDLDLFRKLVNDYVVETGTDAVETAAALARMAQGDRPLLMPPPKQREPERERPAREERVRGERPFDRGDRVDRGDRGDRVDRPRRERPFEDRERGPGDARRGRFDRGPEPDMERYRVEVGHRDGLKPGHIVAAIANATGLPGSRIGRIKIEFEHATVDLPEGMPPDMFDVLQDVTVCRKRLRLSRDRGPGSGHGGGRREYGGQGQRRGHDSRGGGKSFGRRPFDSRGGDGPGGRGRGGYRPR